MGKDHQNKYPDLDEVDQEAVRQHAIAALNLTQKAKQLAIEGNDTGERATRPLSRRPQVCDGRSRLDID